MNTSKQSRLQPPFWHARDVEQCLSLFALEPTAKSALRAQWGAKWSSQDLMPLDNVILRAPPYCRGTQRGDVGSTCVLTVTDSYLSTWVWKGQLILWLIATISLENCQRIAVMVCTRGKYPSVHKAATSYAHTPFRYLLLSHSKSSSNSYETLSNRRIRHRLMRYPPIELELSSRILSYTPTS